MNFILEFYFSKILSLKVPCREKGKSMSEKPGVQSVDLKKQKKV